MNHTVYDGLSIVTIIGHQARGEDRPGTANYFVETFGLVSDPTVTTSGEPGALWSDYSTDARGHAFDLLVRSSDLDSVRRTAAEEGYEIDRVTEVTEPRTFGDSTEGHVEILRHRSGWVVIAPDERNTLLD